MMIIDVEVDGSVVQDAEEDLVLILDGDGVPLENFETFFDAEHVRAAEEVEDQEAKVKFYNGEEA